MDEGNTQRLEAIERRLLALEARLAGTPPAAAVPVVPMDTTLASKSAQDAEAAEQYAVSMRAMHDQAPPAGRVPAAPPPLPKMPANPDGPPMMSAAHNERLVEKQVTLQHLNVPPIGARVAARTARSNFDLEQLLGLKFAGWVGAIVLVIGAALGVKFAYDQHWLATMPAGTRVALIVAAGLLIIGLGEWIFRRVNHIAAAGPYAAGIAVLYLAVYGGQAWYGLFGSIETMVLLAVVAAVGMAIAARADLVAVATLTVLGAVACPAFTGAIVHRPQGFRIYLLAVEAMALGLCVWQSSPKWWVLRSVALMATAFDLLVGLKGGPLDGVVLPRTLFALAAAVCYQAELVFTTWRRQRGRHGEPRAGAVFSFMVTAVFTAMVLRHFATQPPYVRGAMLAWEALAVSALGLMGSRRSLGLTLLGRGYYVQAAVLLTLAIPVALRGPAWLAGWMAMASGLAILAVLTRDLLPAVGATGVWLLTAAALLFWANDTPASADTWLTIGGEAIRASVVMAAALAVAGHITATGLRKVESIGRTREQSNANAGVLIDLAAIGVFAAVLIEFTSPTFATRVGLAYSLLLWAASAAPGFTALGAISIAMLSAVAVKWVAFDVLKARLSPSWTPAGRPFFNAQMATGVAIAIIYALQGWAFRRRAARRPDNSAALAAGERAWAAMLTIGFLLIGLGATVNLEQAIAVTRQAGEWPNWPGYSAIQLAATLLWAAIVVAWLAAVRPTLHTQPLRRDVLRCAPRGRVPAGGQVYFRRRAERGGADRFPHAAAAVEFARGGRGRVNRAGGIARPAPRRRAALAGDRTGNSGAAAGGRLGGNRSLRRPADRRPGVDRAASGLVDLLGVAGRRHADRRICAAQPDAAARLARPARGHAAESHARRPFRRGYGLAHPLVPGAGRAAAAHERAVRQIHEADRAARRRLACVAWRPHQVRPAGFSVGVGRKTRRPRRRPNWAGARSMRL